MRKTIIFILAAGCFLGSYATDARVISMGKHDAFFMDEVSVFRNPANVNIYPNMVYGSFGKYSPNDSNPQLMDPFFGVIVSYSLNEETEAGGQYPMLSLGAMFNRYDEALNYVNSNSSDFIGSSTSTLEEPLGKFDLMLGYVLQNGVMIGAGTYLAMQTKEVDNERSETKIYKGNIGLNWPVAKTMDLEISLGGGSITAIDENETIADQDYFGRFEIRLFSALAGINGDFVPRARIDFLNIERDNILKVDVAAGLGLNLNIDKGFFWAGLEFLYGQMDSNSSESIQNVGGRVSFGIERNILWDWFVIRVGGQKSLMVNNTGSNETVLVENPSFDETENDLVGLGFGINIENRLRIDVVASEIFPYTFSNLISSGPQKYLFSRVSATYSF
ncbi:MAG: hypothetical protein JW863_10015 [Chitinispirillaceae bacterium]|nr:hypothetical protein [Chitinispirillaceae bacterium]